MTRPNRIVPAPGARSLAIALLFACLLLSNCQPGGGNANDNRANANTNANVNANANTNTNTQANTNAAGANVENAGTPEVTNRGGPSPSPTPVNKGTFSGKFCNEQSLGRFPTNAFKSVRSTDTTCVTVRTQSGTGGSTVVFFHCRNSRANCTADLIVRYDDGRPNESYTINCTP
jgi:hypothetical protein